MSTRSHIWLLPLLLLTSTASLAVPIVEDFEAASFVNHTDLGDVTVIGNYRYSVDSAASFKSVVSAAALFPGYDPLRPTTTFTIAHTAGSEFRFVGFVATDQFEMAPASVVVSGYRNGAQVTLNETVTIPWPSANIDFSAKPGFTNVDEVRVSAPDLFFLFESWTADVAILVNSPGSVTINDMTPTQNQILTATASDLDGISGNVSYQWKRGAVVIGNAQNYTTVQADVGQTLTASASYVDDLTTSEQPVSNATSAVTNINDAPVNTGLPVITGTASVGNSLSASTGTWTDADGDTPTYSYQWKRGTTNVGANSNSYTLISADAHTNITVVVTANDANGGTPSATSAITTVANTAPVNTILPAITGTASVGNSLSASTGTWTDADGDIPTYSYQWKRGTTNVGINASSYTLTAADAHANITAVVTFNDGFGGATAATSAVTTTANTAPVNTVTPAISGTASVGNTLNASTGTWTDADGDIPTYSYQWKRGTTNVGTNSPTYTLTSADVHASITIVVTANDGFTGSSTGTSLPTTVSNAAPINTVAPAIGGTALVGNILSASTGTWTDADGDTPTYSYQWKRGTTNVGINAATYTLGSADAHSNITVVVTANDGFSGIVVATSAARAVANAVPVNTVLPVITGTASVGNSLTASNGTWTDADGDVPMYSYQWKRGAANVGTGNSYNLTTADAHASITVVVTANDSNGGTPSATSAITTVANAVPVNTVLPAITGTASVGNTLTASNGIWTDADGDIPTYSYQWKRGVTNVGTGNSYNLTTADAHANITVVVTADDDNGGTPSATSAITTVDNAVPVNTVLPAITGTASVGNSLTASAGTWTDADGDTPTYSYQWKRGVTNVGTGNNYNLTTADAHASITVVVTANDGNGGTPTETSTATTVANTAPVNTGAPVISGNILVGSVVTTSNGSWTDADGDTPFYSYVWKANGSVIAGLSNNKFTVTSAQLGSVLTADVTANDDNGASVTASSLATVAVDGDLDLDGTGDSVDPDIDGDGMTNDYEDANGLDKWSAADQDTDLDGDGVSNFDESNAAPPTAANIDDYPPVITPPADVTVDATGLYTSVDTGVATATDALDGALTPTSDATTRFAPGVNTVIWSATDAANNTGTATQLINVNPIVNLSINQTAREGDTVTIKAILNGSAVTYPVTVPYTVSGTAATDLSDHDLIDGSIDITASNLETSIIINLVDDGADEGDETIIVTMVAPTNAVQGTAAVHTTTISENNQAPQVVLTADQGGVDTRLVAQVDGSVTVTATVTDASRDTHIYDWSLTDNALSDSDGTGNNTFSFDPSTLQPGLYTLKVSVTDNNSGSSEAELLLNVIAAAPVLDPTDTDGDGIDDDVEGHGDSDNDGVPNYLDHSTLSNNVVPGRSATSNQFLIETEPGLKIHLGKVAFRAGKDSINVNMDDVTTHANDGAGATADNRHDYDAGMFDFVISKLPTAGQSVSIVLAQQATIPANAIYRKYVAGGWQNFVEDGNNSLASATGEEGYCPPPGNAAYTAELTEGDWCVQLTIEDGGSNDDDGVANRKITDPGGTTESVPTSSDNDSTLDELFGGSANPLWLLIMGLLPLCRRWSGVNKKIH